MDTGKRVLTLAEHISHVISADAKRNLPPSVSKKSGSSMNEPPSVDPPKTQRDSELSEGDSLQRKQNLGLEEIIRKALRGKYDDQNSTVSPSVDPPKTQSAPLFLVPPRRFVKSGSSVLEPRDSDLQKTQSEPLRETDSTASTVSMRSDSSMYEPPSFHFQRGQSEPLRETDSRASTVSMRSDSSMYEPPCFHLQRGQSEPLRETDSRASNVSMKSDSSMIDPLNFNLKRKQSQLTEEISSCSVCLEAVKDPVRLLCGHRSCKQCSLSFMDQNGSTAVYPCKMCGRRFKGEPEHQTDSEDDKKNLSLPSASRPAPQNTTDPAGREKRDPDLQSVLLEKTIKRVEMETEKLQAEKGSFQAEKEKFDAEKETFQAEKEKFQAEKEKSLAEKEKFELEKRKLALEIKSLEQKGSYNPYVPYSFSHPLN